MSLATTPVRHPAKFSAPILTAIEDIFTRYGRPRRTLDPFAGVGRVHSLNAGATVGNELEPEWARQAPGSTVIGDATRLPFPAAAFDGIVSSPTYGNRLADHQEARERCRLCAGTGRTDNDVCSRCNGKGRNEYRRNTYRHSLGRPLHRRNTGQLQWGAEYKRMHILAWADALRVSAPGAMWVINVSDFLRDNGLTVVPVSAWHRHTITALGLLHLETVPVGTRRNGEGANRDLRVANEDIHVFRVRAVA